MHSAYRLNNMTDSPTGRKPTKPEIQNIPVPEFTQRQIDSHKEAREKVLNSLGVPRRFLEMPPLPYDKAEQAIIAASIAEITIDLDEEPRNWIRDVCGRIWNAIFSRDAEKDKREEAAWRINGNRGG